MRTLRKQRAEKSSKLSYYAALFVLRVISIATITSRKRNKSVVCLIWSCRALLFQQSLLVKQNGEKARGANLIFEGEAVMRVCVRVEPLFL
jgi:hypothetical protein